jgi:hypothetical protein
MRYTWYISTYNGPVNFSMIIDLDLNVTLKTETDLNHETENGIMNGLMLWVSD